MFDPKQAQNVHISIPSSLSLYPLFLPISLNSLNPLIPTPLSLILLSISPVCDICDTYLIPIPLSLTHYPNCSILIPLSLLPSSAQSQVPAGLSIALISSNTPTTHSPGQVVKSWNTSLAPGGLAHHLIKLVKHSCEPKLSKSL